MIAGETVRAAARRCGVHKNTSFRWRHRFLAKLSGAKPAHLHGIVEADETYFLESFKGSRNLPRPARKRGGKAAKRGLSDEQIPVLIARDRTTDRKSLDFVGIFDKLEKALAFDSDEINAIVKDLKLLKVLFKNKMEGFERRTDFPVRLGGKDTGWKTRAPFNFNDKDVDTLIEHFRDPERRKAFFKEYKEIEMLYEIISPDAFLRPFIGDYGTLSAIYGVVRKAYTKTVMVDRDFQRKTNRLVQEQVGVYEVGQVGDLFEINAETIELIKNRQGGDGTKVINLVKSIDKSAENQSDDPYLIAMAERARAVQEEFENRQTSTAEALAALLKELEADQARRKEQAEKGIDGLTYFVYRTLLDAGIGNADAVSRKVRQAFMDFPNWKQSENALRELRKRVTFAVFAETDDLERVTALVDELFTLLDKADRI